MDIIQQQIMDNFDSIVDSHDRIGILISGGIDSGLALHLLLSSIEKTGRDKTVHACTVTKTPDAVENATRVIELISKKFDIVVTHHIVDSEYESTEHMKHTTSAFAWLIKNNVVDIVISATNAIVPDRLLKDRENPSRVDNTSKYMIRPFIEYTKDVTIGLAIQQQLFELLKISHSCIKQTHSRCGTCYWCKEREWGFSKNNFTDPGTT